MCDVRAFCGNRALIRKGRDGKTPAYDGLVTRLLHRLLRPRALALGVSLLASALSGSFAAAQPSAAPRSDFPVALQIAGSAFGVRLEIEVLDLPQPAAEKALGAAWDAVVRAEREVGKLTAAGGSARTVLSPDLFSLVSRALSFCTWSDGAAGPVGATVYRLWEESALRGELPTPDELEEAAKAARCAKVTLQSATRELRLTPGSGLDLRGFARGWAVDLAVRSLVEAGATNLRVGLGPVTRAVGPGPAPERTGWPVALPTLSASGSPLSRVLLQDQAIAVPHPEPTDIQIAGERFQPPYDLRTGRPATGVSSVAAVTKIAADAEPLTMAMSVLGANGGQLRLGSLRPKPSVLWLLGTGDTAVVASSNWSAVRRP